jgi:hypothetical protein
LEEKIASLSGEPEEKKEEEEINEEGIEEEIEE